MSDIDYEALTSAYALAYNVARDTADHHKANRAGMEAIIAALRAQGLVVGGQCKTCRWWASNDGTHGTCNLTVTGWETELRVPGSWRYKDTVGFERVEVTQEDYDRERAYWESRPESLAAAEDSESYRAWLQTTAEFGCVQWEGE